MKSREYYKEKKRLFANKKSYYNNRDKDWGEIYGYDLAEPYSEMEIHVYEQKYNIKLPLELRNYLINISRETIGYYPYIVQLSKPKCEYVYGNNTILNMRCSCNGYCDGNCILMVDKCPKELIENGFHPIYILKTHTNGCSDDTFICLNESDKNIYGQSCSYDGDGNFYINRKNSTFGPPSSWKV